MTTIDINQGDFAWIGEWTQRDDCWLRYVLVRPHSAPEVRTIGYRVYDDGRPVEHDSHDEARQYEESGIADRCGAR